VERDRIGAGVCDCVGQQDDLNLRLSEAAAVDLLENAKEGDDEFG
jgi:hypothetical protein